MKQVNPLPHISSRWYYFFFSVRYLILTALIYASLVAAPYYAVKSHWFDSFVWLCLIFIGCGLLYSLLDGYFKTTSKPVDYAKRMTIMTIFPPVVGPIIVLQRSLD